MKTNKDVYSSLCEREILESLNNIVEVYLEVEDIVDKEIYQGELAKKFIAKSGFNFFRKCLKFFKTLTGKYSRFCLQLYNLFNLSQ